MKRLLLIAMLIASLPASAQSGTLTITASGFSNTAAGAPTGWPTASVTWPGSQSPNGTKTYTVNDADWASLLTWMAANQLGQIEVVTGNQVLPQTPTAAQILLAWLQIWINGTKTSVQQFQTSPAAPPSQITIQ